MRTKKILFPTDFSENSEGALGYATSLARDQGATLLIVHVKEPPVASADTGLATYTMLHDDAALPQLLHEVLPSDPNVPHTHRLLSGSPATAIVQLAADEDVDMIVMGTHGRTGLVRFVLGSVAESVVRRAGCPVLTIKQPISSKAEA